MGLALKGDAPWGLRSRARNGRGLSDIYFRTNEIHVHRGIESVLIPPASLRANPTLFRRAEQKGDGFGGGTQRRGEEEGKSVFEANPSFFRRAEQKGEGFGAGPQWCGEDEGKCCDRRLPWKPHSRDG